MDTIAEPRPRAYASKSLEVGLRNHPTPSVWPRGSGYDQLRLSKQFPRLVFCQLNIYFFVSISMLIYTTATVALHRLFKIGQRVRPRLEEGYEVESVIKNEIERYIKW